MENIKRRKRKSKRVKLIEKLIILFSVIIVCFAIFHFARKIGSGFNNNSSEYQTKVQEYGENNIITNVRGKMLSHIMYPAGNIQILDETVKSWIDEQITTYKNETKDNEGELSVDYSSYVVSDRYISVKFILVYSNSTLANPYYVIKTFNYDKNDNKMISISDVFTKDEISKIENKVFEDAKIDRKNVNKSILENWILTHDGIEIPLGKGVFTVSSDGLVNIKISKNFLEKNNIKIIKEEVTEKVEEKTDDENILKIEEKTVEELKGKKLIALTFDDGPGRYTEELLSILDKNKIKATFFVLGSQTEKYKDVLKKIADSGHAIGNHTWNHRNLAKLSEEDVKLEIMKTREKIREIIGIDTEMVRAPYGSVNNEVKEIAKANKNYFVHWNIDTEDWKNKNPDIIFNKVMESAGDGNIILCHDIHKQTVKSIDRIVTRLKYDGYEFVTIPTLFKVKEKTPKYGSVYFDGN